MIARIDAAGIILFVLALPAAAQSLPDPRLTPGAADPALTTTIICAPEFHARAIRDVPAARRRSVYLAYGMSPDREPCPCELDHLIPLELGGSNEAENLQPQPLLEARRKDRLETALRKQVCSGATTLEAAQRAISSDWVRAYSERFGE